MKIIEFSSGVVIQFHDLIILYDNNAIHYFWDESYSIVDWEGNLLEGML